MAATENSRKGENAAYTGEEKSDFRMRIFHGFGELV